jgi:chromosomal replication initiation ATPase DnaA
MDLLYRGGGIKGVEIGKIMGVDYSTVSQGRKRLREKLSRDKKIKQLVNQIERKLP